MPRISLCMIVRDEAAMLGDCLTSVRGAVDEMVVVDTGSRDASPNIARALGARVVRFEWCDDFAAARNAALSHARGQWILQLDADERLSPGSAKRLRSTVATADFDCGMIRLHDATRVDAAAADVLSGRERLGELQLVARLLRRTSDLAYVDAIHENVMPWIRRRGMRVSGVDADIIHLGATREVVDGKSKIERNTRMLETRLEKDPTDLTAYGYLAHEYLRAGKIADALALTDRGWVHLTTAKERHASVHRLALARAYILIASRRFAEAREAALCGRNIDGNNPDFCFLIAFAWEGEARYHTDLEERRAALDAARTGYLECLTFRDTHFAQSFVSGASSWSGRVRLGTIDLLLRRPADALTWFDSVLAVRPTDREALLGRAEAMIELGDAAGALRRIEGLLDVSPDGWTLAASAVQALGLAEDVTLFTRRAHALLEKGFLAPHRRERLQLLTAPSG